MDLITEFLRKFPFIRNESDQKELIRAALVMFLDLCSETKCCEMDWISVKNTIQTNVSCRSFSKLCSKHKFMDFETKSLQLERKMNSVVDPNILAKQLLNGTLKHFIPNEQQDKEVWYDPKWI